MKPLFVTAPARSGSTLLARILDTHSEVSIASDPLLPFFSHFRNSVWRGEAAKNPDFSPENLSLLDYYFGSGFPGALESVRSANWNHFDLTVDAQLKERIFSRVSYESGDLVGALDVVFEEKTYFGFLDHFLRIVNDVRGGSTNIWAGIKEVWTIDFTESLARDFPEAKFVCLMRDPRAIISSLLAISRKDPSQMAHVPSYLRHWRKYAAMIQELKTLPLLKDRFLVLRYEDLVEEPGQNAESLCQFLDLDFEEGMIDPANFKAYSEGVDPVSNSGFDRPVAGIDKCSSERWRSTLTDEDRELISLLVSPEASLFSYELPNNSDRSSREVEKHLKRYSDGQFSWRSDMENPSLEAEYEAKRWEALRDNPISSEDIQKLFLFESCYKKLNQSKI